MDLRVSHCFLCSLLLVLLAVGQIDCLLCLLEAFLTEVVIGVSLEAGFIGLKGFVVLLEEEVAVSFLVVCLNEVGVLLEGDFIALFSPLELHEFDVDLTDIAVILGDLWVSPHCLLVFLEGLWEFAYINRILPSLYRAAPCSLCFSASSGLMYSLAYFSFLAFFIFNSSSFTLELVSSSKLFSSAYTDLSYCYNLA